MKKLLLFISAMLVWLGAYSQGTIPYSDDFESYTVGGYLAVQNTTWWTTWSVAPGTGEDGQISSAFAHSGTKSVLCDEDPGASDLIMKLGNKTTGGYELKWWMYVETDKCGYYNIQHFQAPGTEWAFEVYLRTSGAGELLVGGVTYAFTYPKAAWFEVKHLIDLDNDNIKMYINGALIREWPFHYQASGTTGTKQLGGVDFFAGAKSGTTEVPKYFFDDVSYTSYIAPSDPIIGVAPATLSATLSPPQTLVQTLTVSNTGVANLNWTASVIMNNDGMNSNPAPIVLSNHTISSATLNNCSADPNPAPSSNNTPGGSPDATAVIHYDGDNSSAIGWNTVPATVTVAARFPNAITLPYAGMNLESVDVYVNALNATGGNLMTVKIYGMGTSYSPGPLLSSQTFTPAGAAWEHIVLTTPVLVTGQDLWIGYQFTQLDAGIYIPGVDAGPNVPDGDFLSTGVGWTHLGSSLPYNWNIRGNLNGTPFPQWLSVAPLSGTVVPGGNQGVSVTFNTSGLTDGVYHGIVRFWSNDPVTPQVDVPVTLTVATVACPMPNTLTVTGITSSGASIGWSGAPQVEIDYGIGAHTAGTGTIVSGVFFSPHPLTGLNYLTSYQVWVRQDCGSGIYSPWAGPLNFTTLEQYNTTAYPVTDGTGYVSNVSFLKKGPWMNASTAANDTSGRGYVKFNISALPANAIITKATLNYYNFARTGTSTGVNWIFPLASDPVTTAGPALYSDCGDGPVAWTGAWGGTAPLWFNSSLNTDGFDYISSKIASGWAGFGIVRASTANYRFSGFNDATYKPYLYVEYHVATAPVLSTTPVSKDFETVNLGIQSIPQTYVIKNIGTGTIPVSGVTLGGTHPSQFLLTDVNTYPQNLGPGASFTVTVAFKPTSVGAKSATLIVTENENEHPVALAGTGYLNGPQNLTAAPVIGPYVNLAWEAPLPLEEIRYDDNTAETYYYNGPNVTTNYYYYTRITIPVNGTLTNLGILSWPIAAPTTWGSIRLCPDLGGLPNLAAPIQSYTDVPVTSEDPAWILQALTPYPVTAGQTYYIVAQWPNSAAGGCALGTDTHNNYFRCGSTPNGGVTWGIAGGNYMMRAYMTVAGDKSSNEPIILTSGNDVKGMQDVPIVDLSAEPKALSGMTEVSVMAPAVVSASAPNKSFTSYTVHRGTVSGTYPDTFTGISGLTYQDVTSAPTTSYYYMVSAEYSNGSANSNVASVTTFETCPVPTELAASGITANSANLGWTPNGTVAWEIQWGVSGFTFGTGTMITTGVTNPYLLGGLTSGVSYSFYVRSSCGSSSFSSWAGPFTFTTVCPPLSLPYAQNFDAVTVPAIPPCWSKYSSAAARPWVTSNNTDIGAHSAPNFAAVFYHATLPKDEWLVSPALLVTPGREHLVKFWVNAPGWAPDPEKLKLVMSTDPSLTALIAAPVLWDGNNLTTTGYTEFVVSFTPTTAGPYYFAWHAYSIANVDFIAMDDISFEMVPLPVDLAVTGSVVSPQVKCYNATNIITVAGTAAFTVETGASATFIAGVKISFMPGTTVQNGGYMLGKISDGTYCGGAIPPVPAAPASIENPSISLEQAYFSIYPNPTNGNFTIVQKGDRQYGNVKVEVYGMRGDKVLTSQMIGEKQREITTSALPAGLYFVKVVADNYTETIKLVKTR